jgi:Domain of unknown function (DUF4166)
MATALVELDVASLHRSAHSSSAMPDFEKLVGAVGWAHLPEAVRRRFAHDAQAVAPTIYCGEALVRASLAGRLLAHVCRVIGTPVVPYVGDRVAMTVRVYRDADGIVWERAYAFADRRCVVRSTKQIHHGALVEKLGAGLHMQLRVFEADAALHFVSDRYFFQLGSLRIELPDWFLPGPTHVTHTDLGGGRFRFSMQTVHGWWGELFYQDGIFE